MTPTTARPVGVGELQRAWRAVQAGTFLERGLERPGLRARPQRRWSPNQPVIPVLGCHPQAGASTLAVAIAEEAAPSRVIECSSTTATGLATAATAELGTSESGWRLGRRGSVEIVRGARVMVTPGEVPLPDEATSSVAVTILDVGWELGQVMACPGWVSEAIAAAPTVVLATTATIPGLRRLENALTMLATAQPLVAVLGPGRRRWPRHLEAALGPAAVEVSRAARVTCIPRDKILAGRGLTGKDLPAPLHRAARTLLAQIAPRTHSTEGPPE